MKKLGALVRVKSVVPLEKFQVRLGFDDGTVRVIDLEPFLWGPVFETIRNDPKVFRSVKVEGGTIVWENGADIDPDVLYYDLKPAWMEKHEAVR